MRRFFVSPEEINTAEIRLTGQLAHRLTRVLGLHPGERVVLLDGSSGVEHVVELAEFTRNAVTGRLVDTHEAPEEPGTEIWLYQSLLKGDSLDLVFEKCTEAGVARFVPMVSERCVVPAGKHASDERLSRWRRIVREAAEQSGRGKLPEIGGVISLTEALRVSGRHDLSIFLWEGEEAVGIREVLEARAGTAASGRGLSIALHIGPEGGFAAEEAVRARSAGLAVVSLGGRILKAETAGLVAAAVCLYALGDLAPKGRAPRG